MHDRDNTDYRPKLIFPLEKALGVNEVIDFIAESADRCAKHVPVSDQPLSFKDWRQKAADYSADAAETPADHRNCPICTSFRSRQQQFLLRELRQAVVQGKIKLWNWALDETRDLDMSSSVGLGLAYIYLDDLKTFCQSLRLRLVFEHEQKNQRTKTLSEEADQPSFLGNQDQNGLSELVDITTTTPSDPPPATTKRDKPPCISEKMVASTKLAIRAAWEIELETTKRASAKDVIKRLQAWIGHSEYIELKSKIDNGVKWVTSKGDEKNYDIDACAKTLANWHKRRAEQSKVSQVDTEEKSEA